MVSSENQRIFFVCMIVIVMKTVKYSLEEFKAANLDVKGIFDSIMLILTLAEELLSKKI